MTAYMLPRRNVTTRTALGIAGVVALFITVLATPALAQTRPATPPSAPAGAPTVVKPALPPGCYERPLHIAPKAGSVRICPAGAL